MKRGLVEMCHIIAVNKCDGAFAASCATAASEYRMAVALLGHTLSHWKVPVLRVSAQSGLGLEDSLLPAIERHRQSLGAIEQARLLQSWECVWTQLQYLSVTHIQQHPQVKLRREEWTAQLRAGRTDMDTVCREIMELVMK
jgi:putative protein kinase ArgK-like GTPase of G3E family